jgi:ElaB/YqjD/DUF883 family membrane-anchored ribosome-binding protein
MWKKPVAVGVETRFEPYVRTSVMRPGLICEDDMDNTTKSYGNEAMSAAENAANRLKNKASEVADKAQEKMDEAIDEVSVRAKEARDAVRDYANQAADKLDESIQTRPMTTLIGAVAVGFVLGALWKR